ASPATAFPSSSGVSRIGSFVEALIPLIVPKLGSYALGYKVIVILDKHKIDIEDVCVLNLLFYSNLRTPFIAQGALYKIRPKPSRKSSSSGNLGSGRDTLTVGKISSSGNHITRSGNALAFYSQQNP
ncbi:hypothetical protein Tco_1551481, partial [Tanacetum coccineum]